MHPLDREMVFNQVAASSSASEDIDLSDGYPQLGAPQFLKELLFEEIGRLRRTNDDVPYGIFPLREVIADDLFTSQGVSVDPVKHVTVTGSASEALTATILAVAARNSAVIFFSPHFPIYSTAAAMAGAKPCYVPIGLDGTADIDAFQSLLTANDVAAVVLNAPHNPTGAIFSEDDLTRLLDFCRKKQVAVVSDEVFAHLAPPGTHLSPMTARDTDLPVIMISDTGKKFDLHGLRLGYIVAEETMTQRIRVIQQALTYRVPVPLQKTVAVGLQWARNGYYDEVRSRIRDNAKILVPALQAGLPTGTWVNTPVAGCFLVATTPGHTGLELAARLVTGANVRTLPGAAFAEGRPLAAVDQFVRISLARDLSQIQDAAARLRAMR